MAQETNQPVGSFRVLRRIYRIWRQIRDKFASALDVDYERKVEIYTQLSESATLKDLVYWLQILFSAGIATLGLVLNSSAVIIGAMLISPLMAPILSQGLALATGDITLGIRAFAGLFLSTVLGVVFAVVLVALLPFKDLTPEIIARTTPNTLDLVIALFSGAIGAVATCRDVKGIATSIPGVAIAVALMPPLCVMGFGLGYAISVDLKEGVNIASGGGLLYLTNLVAITFTSMLVFVVLRIDTVKVRDAVHKWRDEDSESQWWLGQINKIPALQKAREVRSFSLRLLMILLPLLIIFFPLRTSFSKMRANITQRQTQNRISQEARSIWKEHYAENTDRSIRSHIDDLSVIEKDGILQVNLRVFDNRPYTPEEKKAYINRLAEKLVREPETVSLQLVEIPTSQREITKPVVEKTPEVVTVAQMRENYLEKIRTSLADFRLPAPATLVGHGITSNSNGRSYLEIFYLSGRNIENDGKLTLQVDIRRRLATPNIVVLWTRISSDPVPIIFNRTSVETDGDNAGKLFETAEDMRKNPSLSLRVLLKRDENDEKLFEQKKKSVSDFFEKNGEIGADRVVFGESSDEDGGDAAQVFVRN